MKVAVVTTSINAEPAALTAWANTPCVEALVVAGDNNSPERLERFVDELPGGVYVAPAAQTNYAISDHVPWGCIQRRNFALLHALTLPDITHIMIVDDDNAPDAAATYNRDAAHWMNQAGSYFAFFPPVIAPASGWWFDPGILSISHTDVHARGLPYDVDRCEARTLHSVEMPSGAHIGVFQASVLGDPDVDAMERLVNAPDVKRITGTVALSYRYVAPVNSQATLWRRDYAPLAAVPPHLGRMDDIWGGLIAQRIMRQHRAMVAFGNPAVRQDRNPHNLLTDLEREMIGYRHTSRLVDVLSDTDISECYDASGAYHDMHAYARIADRLAKYEFFPGEAVNFMRAWYADVRRYALRPDWLYRTATNQWRDR